MHICVQNRKTADRSRRRPLAHALQCDYEEGINGVKICFFLFCEDRLNQKDLRRISLGMFARSSEK